MVELYVEKSLSKEDALTTVNILAKDKKVMIDAMMVEELGLLESDDFPYGNAVATFLTFVNLRVCSLAQLREGSIGEFRAFFRCISLGLHVDCPHVIFPRGA